MALGRRCVSKGVPTLINDHDDEHQAGGVIKLSSDTHLPHLHGFHGHCALHYEPIDHVAKFMVAMRYVQAFASRP